jgi:hypothetical protein
MQKTISSEFLQRFIAYRIGMKCGERDDRFYIPILNLCSMISCHLMTDRKKKERWFVNMEIKNIYWFLDF